MTTFTRSRLIPLLAALLMSSLVLTACERKPSSPAVLSSSDSVLRYIPADTPYVLVNPEPLDDDLVRKMFGEAELLSKGYELALRDSLTIAVDEYPEGSEERDRAERAAVVMNDVLALFSLDGMREAGFDTNESMAVYGHGLLPVLRAKLIDPDAFETAIADIETKAGYELDTADIEGRRYRYAEDDEGRIVLGAFDDYVVLTFLPAGFGDDELRQLVVIELPATDIAAARTQATIAGDYGYTSHYMGYVDIQRIVNTFAGTPTGLDALLLEDQQSEFDSVSDVCREEIMEFAGIAPRAVFGYSKIATDGVDGSMTVELRSDLAKGLMAVPAVVPGLGVDGGSLFTAGIGVDPRALRDFVEARLDAMAADPYECELFAELEQNAEEARAALTQPIPPVVYGFRGVVAVFEAFDVAAMQSGAVADSEAAVLVAVDDAPGLLMTAAMFSPELAALDLQPDGEPVALELSQTAWMPEPPYVALTDDSLAVSVGGDSRARIERLLSAKGADPAPFMSFAGDAGRYYGMIGDTIGTADDSDELSPEAREAIRDSMQALAAVYDRLQVDVRLTSRGVTVDAGLTFKD